MSNQEDFNKKIGTKVAESKPDWRRELARTIASSTPQATVEDSPDNLTQVAGPAKSWATSDGLYWPIGESHPVLPANLYKMESVNGIGPCFRVMQNITDSLVIMPDSESEKIVEEIKVFQSKKNIFEKHGFLHKRGILLWGPPGSGKTTTLQLLISLITETYNGVAVMIDHPGIAISCLQRFRRSEPDRQIVAIMEDLDGLVELYGESEYLNLLDGESQVDNVVFVATTNYPERLDRRFVDRPSRFDSVRFIGMPSDIARRAYFQAKIPDVTKSELDEYVGLSKDFSVAHLREFIILTKCFETGIKESAERLRKAIDSSPNSTKEPDAPKFGFS